MSIINTNLVNGFWNKSSTISVVSEKIIVLSVKTIIRQNLMEPLLFIINLIGIKNFDISILGYVNAGTHKKLSLS